MTLNVLYVTGQLWDADFLEHELRKIAPNVHLDVSPRLEDALVRVASPGRYDAVLLDSGFAVRDSQNFIVQVRELGLPLAMIVLIPAAKEEPPGEILEAGADECLTKRPNFAKSLPGILQRAVERRRTEAERQGHPLQVLYAGDPADARQYFSRAPLVSTEAAVFNPDGSLQLPATGSGRLPYDAVVVDNSSGPRVMRILSEISAHAADTPVILLVDSGAENVSAQALKMGAAECIVKNGDFLPHLLSSLDSAVRLRDANRGLSALKSSEARLRLLVESIPACVALLTADGVFQAMNWAGLALAGAARVDQIVGKSIYSLTGPACEEELRCFLAGVCGGSRGVLRFKWHALDGAEHLLEMNAAPLRRDSESAASVLAVLREPESRPAPENATPGQIPAAEAAPVGHPEEHDLALLDAGLRLGLQQDPVSGHLAGDSSGAESDASPATDSPNEGQIVVLKESLRIVEAAYAELEREFQLSRARWEGMQEGYEEAPAAPLAAANTGGSAMAADRDGMGCDAPGGEARELEQRCQTLEAALETAEMNFAQMQEAHLKEAEEWRRVREDLENRLQKGAAAPEHPEDDAARPEGSYALLASRYREELSGWQKEREALEQRCLETELQRAGLEDRVRGLSESWVDLSSQNRSLREEGERTRLESEKRREEAEKQRAALAEQIAWLTGDSEEMQNRRRAEQADLEQARIEWEQRLTETENRRAELAEQLARLTGDREEAEARHRAERAELEKARLEADGRLTETENRRAELAEQLARLTGDREEAEARHRAERAELERARLEADSNLSESENRRAELAEQITRLTGGREESESRRRAEMEEQEMARLEWEKRLGEAENLRVSLAEQVVKLTGDCEKAESRFRAEFELRDGAYRGLEGRQIELEEIRKRLEDQSVVLQARLAQLEERCLGDRADWERERLELRRAAQEAADRCAGEQLGRAQSAEKARTLEIRCAGVEEKYRAEKEAHEKVRLELERQRQEQRVGVAAFEDALKVAEERVALVQKQQRIDQTGWLATRSHLQRRFEALETELNALQARHESAMAKTRMDREGWEAAREEFGRRQAAAEEARTALARDYQALQTRLEEFLENRRAETAAWDKERQELQAQIHELDAEVRGMGESLAEAEAAQEKLLAERQRDRAILDDLRVDLENQRLVRIALEDALHISEMRRVELQEKGQADRAEHQAAQEELDRQRVSLRALEEALLKAENRLTRLAEDQRAEGADLAVLRRELEGQRAARVALGRALRAAELRDKGKPGIEPEASPATDSALQAAECQFDLPSTTATHGGASTLLERMPDQTPVPETADLNAVVTQMTVQGKLQLDDKVELLTIFSPRLPQVIVSGSLAERLLSALLRLAGDALPFGGVITLETRVASQEPGAASDPFSIIAATVSGCSVLLPADASPLEQLVLECHGKLTTYGDPDTGITIEIALPAETLVSGVQATC